MEVTKIDFSTLQTFLLLAETGSFSQTARIQHLTQPAVSHQIKILEEELGQILVERRGRHTRLTPAGELFLPYAQRILGLYAEGKNLLADFRGKGGRFSLGAGTTTIIFRLPDLLQKFREQFPETDLVIKAGNSREITDLTLHGTVDFGLVTTPAPAGKLKSIPLYQDQILLVTPPDWKNSCGELHLVDLENEPLILFPRGSGFRDFLELTFRTHHFLPKVTMELDSIEGIKQMVSIGMGLSFLPEVALNPELANGELKTFKVTDLENLHRTTYLIYLPERSWTAAMKGFVGILKENLRFD